jgi:hypothetical protein
VADERGGKYFREARFFLAGDKVVATSHVHEARMLMGYMRDQLALGGPPIQVQYATLGDGTIIRATMMNGQYQAQIESPGGRVVPIEQDYWPIVVHSAVDNEKRVAHFVGGCGIAVKSEPEPKFGRYYWCGHGVTIFATATNPAIESTDLWMRYGSVPATLIGAAFDGVVGFTEYGGQVFVVTVVDTITTPGAPSDMREVHTYTYKLHTLTSGVLTLVHTCTDVAMLPGEGGVADVRVAFNDTGNRGLGTANVPISGVGAHYNNQELLQIAISGSIGGGFAYVDTRVTAIDGYDLGAVTVGSRIAVDVPDYHLCSRVAYAVDFRGDIVVMLVREFFSELGHTTPATYNYFRQDVRVFEVVGGVEGVEVTNATYTYGASDSIGYIERVHGYMYIMSADVRIGAYAYIVPTGVTFDPITSSPSPPYFLSAAKTSGAAVIYRLMGNAQTVYTASFAPAEINFDKYPFEYTPYSSPTGMAISRILSVPHTDEHGVVAIHPYGLFFSPYNVGHNVYNYFSNSSAVKLHCGSTIVDVTPDLTNGTADANATRYTNFGIR